MNPATQVIVKVANSYEMLHPEDGQEPSDFKYYAGRTTDYTDQDIRVWSIDIPRGVEVWGGYTDVPMKMQDGKVVADTDAEHTWSNDYNGFYSGTTDLRDILGNPTYFDAAYYNKAEKQNSTCYHVVSFTDKVYDGEGLPYLKDNTIGGASTYEKTNDYANDAFKSMASVTTDRAVIDGIFISGGKADIASAGGGQSANINQYGGAAIVTSFAHVRNCIARGNQAVYGGALALTDGALVSGTLMDQNEAHYGGALYVFEDETKLSDGTKVSTGQSAEDFNKMPKIFTSTIANNTATKQGGGLWFTGDYSNVRLNSTLIWKNECNDAANVSGNYNPTQPDDSKIKAEYFFPFAYSAVENMRITGANNISVKSVNRLNVRFGTDSGADATNHSTMVADNATDAEYGYYLPTNYSTLLRRGMPKNEYENYVTSKILPAADFAGLERTVETSSGNRSYIDIGARALDKVAPAKQLMLRLYVAQPEDVDIDAAQDMMDLAIDAATGSEAEYYSQEGSSFAFPFQSLQDALDYIYTQRSGGSKAIRTDANNLPFEIMVAKGTYHPTRDLVGNYGQSLGNTFAIPEGVGVYGGYAVNELGTGDNGNKAFYGKYYIPNSSEEIAKSLRNNQNPTDATAYFTYNNVTTSAESATVGGYTFKQIDWNTMAKAREHYDANGNDIVEPWEFANETILSGDALSNSSRGVYHVVTVVPDQNVVGMLPAASIKRDNNGPIHYVADGYHDYEEGQTIVLNGLKIEGGTAHTYNDDALDNFSKYSYYHGGGILIDGNRYCDEYNKNNGATTGATVYKHTGVSNAVGYRDIPVVIANCWLRNNEAGYGGAISGNNTIDIIASSLESNLALGKEERNISAVIDGVEQTGLKVAYPGQGGAVYSTAHVAAINTMLANNEARSNTYSFAPTKYLTLRNQDESKATAILPGCGGAIYCGKAGYVHLLNSNVVRNMANVYPAIFTMNPNSYPEAFQTGQCTVNMYTQFLNSVFWGNEVNKEMWNNCKGNAAFKFSAPLICNYAPMNRTEAYDPTLTLTSQSQLDGLMDVAWFSAYEDGRGITPKNDIDLRDEDYKPYLHAMTYINSVVAQKGGTYQNCNISIDSSNDVLEGPNFVNPSRVAGVDGYMESADWSPARLNKLTDQGSGRIEQTIGTAANNYTCDFPTYSEAGKTPDASRALYSCETVNDYITQGAYTVTRYLLNYPNYNAYLSVGKDYYMQSAYESTDGNKTDFFRISYDPNPTHHQTYIDIGVYEYRHTPLSPETVGDEVDILWVSNVEKPENGPSDGSSWSQPTSDLQRAIETLLSSRNGHRKEIRLMDGEYTPIYTIKDHLSFYIDTKYLNQSVMLPKNGTEVVENLGVKSFTIKGGYSKELLDIYDPVAYPAIIKGQTRIGDGSQWDHAIFINDATQRYGIKTPSEGDAYTASNGYGWWETQEDQTSKPVPNTIPIQIDGVTVINNNSLPKDDENASEGSAIYYADQSFGDDGVQSASGTIHATAPVSANITTVASDVTDEHQNVVKENPAKLILSKTKVYGSNGASAVYVGQYGGEALIYNNVFHSNDTDPLKAFAAKTINNTFALNNGQVQLKADRTLNSSIFNSVLWKNNMSSAEKNQFTLNGVAQKSLDITANAATFANNTYTGGNNEAIDYNYEETGNVIKANNGNTGLKDENSDAIYGPNFIDPENASVALRDFALKPSLRLLNHGDNAKYNDNVTEAYTIYEYAWVPTTDIDAGGKQRISNVIIDLGAYEFQSKQKRVLYVIPSNLTQGTGDSWSDALGQNKIQAAIDLAAVYYKTFNQEAYVFVRSSANKGDHSGETITLRNGVSVYGSIDTDWNEVCEFIEDADQNKIYPDEYIDKYVDNTMMYHRKGILGTRLGNTRVYGINTVGAAFDEESTRKSVILNADGTTTESATTQVPTALIDGFEVTNNGDKVDGPVVYINPKKDDTHYATGGMKMVLRNIVVQGNDYSNADGENSLVYINNALLYECLMHSNKVNNSSSVLKVGDYGYVVNATVEGKTTGADGSATLNNVSGSDNAVSGNTTASHVYNSITNYADDDATWKTLSGYAYKMDEQSLNYQLAEYSKYIDALPSTNPLTGVANNLAEFISYTPTISNGAFATGDKDLLGNMRLQTLGGMFAGKHSADAYAAKIDRGAFETWKVTRDVECVFPDYPHDGSVEYVMEGKSLIIDPVTDPNEQTGDNNATAHFPGFVLLKNGASLYGNGRAINANYVAVERTVKGNGSVVALPYAMDYKKTSPALGDEAMTASVGVAVPGYTTDGVLELTDKSANVYKYNGANRSNWKHDFHDNLAAGDCWDEVESAGNAADASEGVLFIPAGDNDVTLRYTAKGANSSDFIYKEEMQSANGNHQKKIVTLKKYDDSESTNGGADYTEAEDQGWNCIGLPYLVSNYSTMATTTAAAHGTANEEMMMQNPHTMWLFYDGVKYADGTTNVNGKGGFYSVSSWDATDWHLATAETAPAQDKVAAIWVGEGIFVQNQKFSGDEQLTFYRPIAPTLTGSSENLAPRAERFYYTDGIEELTTGNSDRDGERVIKYVERGKVYIIKNGKKYNSAGQITE